LKLIEDIGDAAWIFPGAALHANAQTEEEKIRKISATL